MGMVREVDREWWVLSLVELTKRPVPSGRFPLTNEGSVGMVRNDSQPASQRTPCSRTCETPCSGVE